MPIRLASGVLIVFAIWLSTIACDSKSIGSGKKFDTATSPPSTRSYANARATPRPKATPTPDMEAAARFYGHVVGWQTKDLSFDEAKVRLNSAVFDIIDAYFAQIEYYGIDVYHLYPYCITTVNLILLDSLMNQADHPASAYAPTKEIIEIIDRAQDSELQAASWEERSPPYSTRSIEQCEEYFDYVQLHGYTPSPVN